MGFDGRIDQRQRLGAHFIDDKAADEAAGQQDHHPNEVLDNAFSEHSDLQVLVESRKLVHIKCCDATTLGFDLSEIKAYQPCRDSRAMTMVTQFFVTRFCNPPP